MIPSVIQITASLGDHSSIDLSGRIDGIENEYMVLNAYNTFERLVATKKRLPTVERFHAFGESANGSGNHRNMRRYNSSFRRICAVSYVAH